MKFRPRFSVRTLAIVVTVLCAYFAAWMPTRRAAEKIGSPDDPAQWINSSEGRDWTLRENAHSPAPLVMSQVEWQPGDKPPYHARREYYLWLFGPKFKLPFSTSYTPARDPGA
jgi:hypothetical protein